MKVGKVAIACVWLALAPWTGAAADKTQVSYDVHLRIYPDLHRIEARAAILNPPVSRLYLNESLEIRSMTSGGKEIEFEREKEGPTRPYTLHGRPVRIKKPGLKQLVVEYAGVLPELENEVNGVGPDLVELALYLCWYPAFPEAARFTFKLEVDLPRPMIVTTNGRKTGLKMAGSRAVSRWESFVPGMDIVVLASPLLKVEEARDRELQIEMLYARLNPSDVERKRANLVSAMRELSKLYGRPRSAGFLRFAYSPRPGWGYSRMPLFVVSESYASRLSEKEHGAARDFHGCAHELAHFWWMIADSDTPDDWINEGLAEYSAFRISNQLFGEEFAQLLLNEYQQHAREAPSDLAIAETTGSSKARYVNRYEKTTLMFREAAIRFGQDRLDSLLRRLLKRFARSRDATTALFLAEAEKSLGAEGKEFFSRYLYGPWSGKEASPVPSS